MLGWLIQWELEERMNRRHALIGFSVVMAARGLGVSAAAQGRRPLVAILLVGSRSEATGRLNALAELGWVDGSTVDLAVLR